jgi:hypothetical protein
VAITLWPFRAIPIAAPSPRPEPEPVMSIVFVMPASVRIDFFEQEEDSNCRGINAVRELPSRNPDCY